MFGIEGRYATALYSAATKQNVLEQVEKDLLKFQAAVNSNQKLKDYLLNPTIKTSLKATVLKDAATKASMSAPSTNLLEVLAENGRLKNFNSIINSFKVIMAAHRGEVSCALYSYYLNACFFIELAIYHVFRNKVTQVAVVETIYRVRILTHYIFLSRRS